MSLSILTPLNLELPLKPQLNRRYPHELHWRVAPPRWGGNIKGAMARLYPGMMDGDCCMQCGAVPCPYDHEQARQTRLADLEFIKELAKDRREMKQTIAQMKDDMGSYLERQRVWKEERLRMKEELRMYEGLRRDWNREKMLMDAELKRLKGLNDKQQVLLTNARKDQQKIVTMSKRISELEAERDQLKEENTKFRKMIVNQSTQMSQMEFKFKSLQDEIAESKAKVRTLTVQLDESTEQLQKVRKELWDKESVIREMDSEIKSLLGTMEVKTRTFERKEAESMDIIRELRHKINALKDTLQDSQNSNKELTHRIQIYIIEIERLKQKMQSDRRFKQFVDIKRENNSLKGQNEKLSLKILETDSGPKIPMMKKSGKVTTRRSRVMSAGSGMTLNSSSSGEGKLRRAKSSNIRTLVSTYAVSESDDDDDDDGRKSY